MKFDKDITKIKRVTFFETQCSILPIHSSALQRCHTVSEKDLLQTSLCLRKNPAIRPIINHTKDTAAGWGWLDFHLLVRKSMMCDKRLSASTLIMTRGFCARACTRAHEARVLGRSSTDICCGSFNVDSSLDSVRSNEILQSKESKVKLNYSAL